MPADDLPGVRSPLNGNVILRAVLFDLDGTLYRQRPLRLAMAAELLTLAVRHPLAAPRRWRAISAYRKAQESMRTTAAGLTTARAQIEWAAERSGVAADQLEALVEEWMIRRPLKYMAACRAAGLFDLLAFLEQRQVMTGVFSDYPPAQKLQALGISTRFSLVLCASDAEIGAFKPDPRGFAVACERWRLTPREVLMVGDRADVDATGAARAGLPCVIIGNGAPSADHPNVLFLRSLKALHRRLAQTG